MALPAPRRLTAALMLLAASAVQAQQPPRTYSFSGAELLTALEGNMPSGIADTTQRQRYSSTYAQAYIVGVADLTQGRLWCTKTGVLPHELSDRVHTFLQDQPASALRGNAGTLTGQALRQAFPCAAAATGKR
ncbi:hypothetical protein CEG14_20085 [Bordetella genomosp. 1]|uniref:Rap1a immunity protein domain-containing protein n=1 Tax=Bordetella genomosp. 1 TaxID=1395607 RepID=A0A261S7K9_9BORD|nr:Rap1a/Tai family immunity protein [Bordetella genomosp. 1]OZI33145.1 hypothetical protein CEG14_20085 [Bordetella genomosp. 1]OZI57253.1 hypothetical protein CAL27_23750 [Bordetella genomosp. 1]